MKNAHKPIVPIADLNKFPSGLRGLSKREYFAGLAMQGILASGLYTSPTVQAQLKSKGLTGSTDLAKAISLISLECADELLKQLGE